MDRLNPSTSEKMVQVDRSTFEELLEIITPHLDQRNEVKAKNSQVLLFPQRHNLLLRYVGWPEGPI
jgi:hypothetical protein